MNYGKKKPVKKAAKKVPAMTYGGAMSAATRQIKMNKGGKTPTALISALKAAGHLTYGGPAAMPKKKKKK
jgi:hypothetical protein